MIILCPNRFPNYLCAKNDASLSYSFSLVLAAQPEEENIVLWLLYVVPIQCKIHIKTFIHQKEVLAPSPSKLPLASLFHQHLYTVNYKSHPHFYTLPPCPSLSFRNYATVHKTHHFIHLPTLKTLENGLYINHIWVYI